jgi:hypothetical protein
MWPLGEESILEGIHTCDTSFNLSGAFYSRPQVAFYCIGHEPCVGSPPRFQLPITNYQMASSK